MSNPLDQESLPPGVSYHVSADIGVVDQLMNAKDWHSTSLGPRESWPVSLKNYIQMIKELSTPAIIFWGPDRVQFYNDGYSVIMGPRHPKYFGSTYRECWPETYSIINPWMQRVLQRGDTVRIEEALVPLTRYGYTEESHFTSSFSPLRDDRGVIAGILQFATEVTDTVLSNRRAAILHNLINQTIHARTVPNAIHLSLQVLQQDVADLPFCLVYLIDPIEQTKLACFGLSGLPSDQKSFPQIIDIGDNTLIPEISRVILERKPILINNLTTRVGSLAVGLWPESPDQAVICPIASADRQSVIGILIAAISPRLTFDDRYQAFLDLVSVQIGTMVSAARACEDEEKRIEELAEFNKAKSLFFSNVSHEFRTPLTLILGPIEESLLDAKSPDEREVWELLYRNALRLKKLVGTLLDFSRIESGCSHASYEATDLAAYTIELTGVFRSALDKAGIILNVDCPPLPEPVYVDREMWEKIVFNLLSNALKFTFEGEIAVSLRYLGTHVELDVKDTGIGIAQDELPRLFERFYRIRSTRARTHEGTGIGLALVQEMAKLHGGDVRARSVSGRGTTFTVCIPIGSTHLKLGLIRNSRPLSVTATGAAPFINEALMWLPGKQTEGQDYLLAHEVVQKTLIITPLTPRAKVLLVDDNSDMRDYIRRLLSEIYDIEAVADGKAALTAARKSRPDLILTDIMMPELDGMELLAELRADLDTMAIPVIILSARAGEEAKLDGLQKGADDYLIKPFRSRELIAKIGAQLDHVRREALKREAELRSYQRINEILESITDAFYAVDANWQLTYVNHKAKEWWNRHREELIGTSLWDLFPKSRETHGYLEHDRAMRERIPVQFETFFPNLLVWVEANIYPNSDGGLSVYCQNITQRKRAEEALRQSEACFHRIFHGSPAMVSIISREDNKYIEVNQKFLEVLEYSRRQVIGRTADELNLWAENDMPIKSLSCSATVSGEDQSVEISVRTRSGRNIIVLITISEIVLHENKCLMHTMQEITTQKKIELEMLRLDRLNLVGEMAVGIAHEIRNPLTTVRGYLQLYQRKQEIAKYHDQFKTMIEELDCANLIITEFLSLAKDKRLNLQRGNLSGTLEALFPLIQAEASVLGHEVQIRSGDLPNSDFDPSELRQLILNLAKNGLEAMETSGMLTLRTYCSNGAIILEVQDTGPGIPSHVLEHLGTPFLTTKDNGTGLGLAVCYRIAQRHSARISVRSMPTGTIFLVSFKVRQ